MPYAIGNTARARSTLLPPTKTVERWEDVPRFASEGEEARFWAEHELAGEALASMGNTSLDDELPPRSEARTARSPRSRK